MWADLDVDVDQTSCLPSCNRPIRFQLDVSRDRLAEIAEITDATRAAPNIDEGPAIGRAATGVTDPG